jgi:hypothetical protein
MQVMWEASDKRHMERMESIDRRLDATSKLLRTGAKLLLRVEESQRKLVENLRIKQQTQGKNEGVRSMSVIETGFKLGLGIVAAQEWRYGSEVGSCFSC